MGVMTEDANVDGNLGDLPDEVLNSYPAESHAAALDALQSKFKELQELRIKEARDVFQTQFDAIQDGSHETLQSRLKDHVASLHEQLALLEKRRQQAVARLDQEQDGEHQGVRTTLKTNILLLPGRLLDQIDQERHLVYLDYFKSKHAQEFRQLPDPSNTDFLKEKLTTTRSGRTTTTRNIFDDTSDVPLSQDGKTSKSAPASQEQESLRPDVEQTELEANRAKAATPPLPHGTVGSDGRMVWEGPCIIYMLTPSEIMEDMQLLGLPLTAPPAPARKAAPPAKRAKRPRRPDAGTGANGKSRAGPASTTGSTAPTPVSATA